MGAKYLLNLPIDESKCFTRRTSALGSEADLQRRKSFAGFMKFREAKNRRSRSRSVSFVETPQVREAPKSPDGKSCGSLELVDVYPYVEPKRVQHPDSAIITPLEAPNVSQLTGLFGDGRSVKDRVFEPVDLQNLNYCRSTRASGRFEDLFRSAAPSPPDSISELQEPTLRRLSVAEHVARIEAKERASELAAQSATLVGVRQSRKTLVKTSSRKRRRNRGVSISVTVSVPSEPKRLTRPKERKF